MCNNSLLLSALGKTSKLTQQWRPLDDKLKPDVGPSQQQQAYERTRPVNKRPENESSHQSSADFPVENQLFRCRTSLITYCNRLRVFSRQLLARKTQTVRPTGLPSRCRCSMGSEKWPPYARRLFIWVSGGRGLLILARPLVG